MLIHTSSTRVTILIFVKNSTLSTISTLKFLHYLPATHPQNHLALTSHPSSASFFASHLPTCAPIGMHTKSLFEVLKWIFFKSFNIDLICKQCILPESEARCDHDGIVCLQNIFFFSSVQRWFSVDGVVYCMVAWWLEFSKIFWLALCLLWPPKRFWSIKTYVIK